MTQSHLTLPRTVLTTLVAAPLGIMGILSVTVLLPTLKDPQSAFYSSFIGYPARQRVAGKPIEVQTVPVGSKTLQNSLSAPGESTALQEVEVRPLVLGPVEAVYVKEGQRVRQGQPLLRIQQSPFEDKVNKARNDVAIAQGNFSAVEISTAGSLQKLENDVEEAQARFKTADTKLAKIDSLAEGAVKNNVAAAQVRVDSARKKLEQIKPLVEQGAIPQIQLYDAQDTYATRQIELLNAQQGGIGTQNQQFSNGDFYISRKADLVSAQQALELAKKTRDKQLADAHLTLATKQIQLQEVIRDLNRTVIYASTDGLVSQVNIHTGELAGTRNNDSLITLTQNIVFKAFVDQARLNSVKIGNQATVHLTAYPGRLFQGRVIQINPTVETEAIKQGNKVGADRQYTYSVWVTVDSLQMPPGLQGYVQFDQGKSSLVIPESAVTHLSGGEGMVMVADAGRASVKKVKIGRTFDNQREVLEGLKTGEQVVLNPRALNPGDDLAVAPRKSRKN